ncbi:MAG TPA: hypothetical protein DCQ28_13490 [Bacteroidetes bacterium]|nr:hypothetical protein [Bacteroidota bacterium]
MRKIILYIASSLDGFIADQNNNLDWLTVYTGNYGYEDFISTVDTVLCGRKTYDEVVKMGVTNPHPNQMNYVFTHSPKHYHSSTNILFTDRNPIELAKELLQQEGKDIFLVGGGELIRSLMKMKLVDEIILFIVPIILGNGIPMFKEHHTRINFETVSVKKYDDGMIALRLRKR